jgi:hypothetical protein
MRGVGLWETGTRYEVEKTIRAVAAAAKRGGPADRPNQKTQKYGHGPIYRAREP